MEDKDLKQAVIDSRFYKKYICESIGISNSQFSEWISGNRGLPKKYKEKLIVVLSRKSELDFNFSKSIIDNFESIFEDFKALNSKNPDKNNLKIEHRLGFLLDSMKEEFFEKCSEEINK